MKNNYIGWIPCVNGNLDFGLMRVGIKGGFTDKKINDEKVIEKNYSASQIRSKHDRLVVLQSKVNWRDSPQHAEDLGSFRVFVTARATASDLVGERCLEGHILLYPLEAEPSEKSQVHDVMVHDLSHQIDEANISSIYPKLEYLLRKPKDIIGLKPDCFKISFSFKVLPSGITRIYLNTESDELDAQSAYLMARQAFYYLKYSIHSHKHHVDEQDSLTTITPESPGCGLRLVCQLKRELTSLSRSQRVDNKVDETKTAKGIIGYTKSLLLGLHKEKLLVGQELENEQGLLDNVTSSFESQENSILRKEQRIETIKSKSKVWLGFSLIFAWGLANFAFSTTPKKSLEGWYLWLVPMLILAFLAMLYFSLKNYYKITSSGKKLMKVYGFTIWTVIKRISAPLAVMLILIVWLGTNVYKSFG